MRRRRLRYPESQEPSAKNSIQRLLAWPSASHQPHARTACQAPPPTTAPSLRSTLPCRRQQQKRRRRIKQNCNAKDEPAHHILVRRADQRRETAHRTKVSLGRPALAVDLGIGILDLEAPPAPWPRWYAGRPNRFGSSAAGRPRPSPNLYGPRWWPSRRHRQSAQRAGRCPLRRGQAALALLASEALQAGAASCERQCPRIATPICGGPPSHQP
jgi:hypothetical protein